MKSNKDKDVNLLEIFMIDPATGLIEICFAPEARVDLVANELELTWLARYPLPNKITTDRGKELLAEFTMVDRGKELLAAFKTMMANDYEIQCYSISVRNPQANALVE